MMELLPDLPDTVTGIRSSCSARRAATATRAGQIGSSTSWLDPHKNYV